jgi:biopolymer transport protein TolR
MDAGGPKGKAKSDINVTPLIDIVLVLLIVFIVMVPGLSKALPVVVPQVIKTDTPPPPPDPRNPPVMISVLPSKDNTNYEYLLQSDAITLEELPSKLAPVVQLQPFGMRKVFLKIDEETPYQVAVNVLDRIRMASDRAKKETLAKPDSGGFDGGDTKVAISLKKRNP